MVSVKYMWLLKNMLLHLLISNGLVVSQLLHTLSCLLYFVLLIPFAKTIKERSPQTGPQHYSTIFDIIQQYLTTFNNIRHYSTIFAIFDDIPHYSAIFNNIGHYLTIFSIFRAYLTFSENSTVFDIIQQYSTRQKNLR